MTAAEQTADLKRLIADFGITMRVDKIAEPAPWDDTGVYNGQGWKCELRLRGQDRRLTTRFWMGRGHVDRAGYPRKPKVDEVLDCLLSDASGAGQPFEEWCRDYGYDSDSRKAYATWEEIEQQTDRLKTFLGSHYERFLYAERL